MMLCEEGVGSSTDMPNGIGVVAGALGGLGVRDADVPLGSGVAAGPEGAGLEGQGSNLAQCDLRADSDEELVEALEGIGLESLMIDPSGSTVEDEACRG